MNSVPNSSREMPCGSEKEDCGKPTVAVVIAAYNAAEFIGRAIASVLNQTYAANEIIVVDDASTDSTVDVVTKIIAADDRVRLLRLPTNGGPSVARNAGFASALSAWIAVLDADDAYLPDRLSHLMSKSADADILADHWLPYDPWTDAVPQYNTQAEVSWKKMDMMSAADPRTKLGLYKPIFRRSFLERLNLRYSETVRHGEDFLLAFEAIARGARHWLSSRPGYLYTLRSSGWSRTQLDYRTLSENVEALAKRDDLDLPRAVRKKLMDRAAHQRDLQAWQQLRSSIRQKRYVGAIHFVAGHPNLWPMVWREAYRYLFRS